MQVSQRFGLMGDPIASFARMFALPPGSEETLREFEPSAVARLIKNGGADDQVPPLLASFFSENSPHYDGVSQLFYPFPVRPQTETELELVAESTSAARNLYESGTDVAGIRRPEGGLAVDDIWGPTY